MKEGDNPLDHTEFQTQVDEMGYILREHNTMDEELNDPDEREYIIFVGSHNDLNLYILWYGQENPGVTLVVESSFVPIVRRLSYAGMVEQETRLG